MTRSYVFLASLMLATLPLTASAVGYMLYQPQPYYQYQSQYQSQYQYQPQMYQYQQQYQQQMYWCGNYYSYSPCGYNYNYSYYPSYNYGYTSYNYYNAGPSAGIPTGDSNPFTGAPLCTYPAYGAARYDCGSDPHQWIYDYWTGTWY